MANTSDPIFGHIRGRQGNLVIYQMNGKTVVRTRPAVKRKPATGALKQSQEDFAAVIARISALRHLVSFGFDAVAVNRSPFHTAVSHNLKRYRRSSDKDQRHWLLLSCGDRAQAAAWSCTSTGDQLHLTWEGTQPAAPALPSDRLVVFLVQQEETTALLLPSAGQRSDQQAIINLPEAFQTVGCDCFTAFYTHELIPKKHPAVISDSVWAGRWQ